MDQEIERQLAKIRKIDEEAQQEQRILEEVSEERKITLSTLVGEAWMTKTFPDKYATLIDPLLTKKFRTKAGRSSIRLEKLLLELDKVDTLGNEDLRTKRKEEVRYLQHLLKQADELNVKANRLVDFQDQLANVGRSALRSTLEASNKAEADSEMTPSESPKAGERRFAAEVPEKEAEDASSVSPPVLSSGPEDFPAKSKDDEVQHEVDNDSIEEVQARSHEHDEQARKYYEQKQTSDVDDEPSLRHHSQPTERHPAKVSRVSRITSPEPRSSQPEIQINEMPRAYVMIIEDANVGRAKVTLTRDSALILAVPGKKPMRYSLGSDINIHGITKEVQGNLMKLVLPKVAAMPMRTGRSFTEAPAFSRGWGRDDFWSRF